MKYSKLLIPAIIVLIVAGIAYGVSGQSEATGTITQEESNISSIISSISEFTEPLTQDTIEIEVINIVNEHDGYIGNQRGVSYNGVEIEITNNGDDSISYAIDPACVVYDDGTQVSELSIFTTLVNDKYRDTNRDYLSLYPGGKKQFNFAFNNIDMSRNPNLVVTLVIPPHQGADKKRVFLIPL